MQIQKVNFNNMNKKKTFKNKNKCLNIKNDINLI